MRCFIAVDVSPEVRDALATVQARLREAAPGADVRWTRPDAVHLTLKFLGEVTEEAAPALARALADAAAGHATFRLAARGVGAFPTVRRARVVWAGVAGDIDALARLAADVERTVAPLGHPTEPRPFTAHLTLGRVRTPRGGRALGDAIEAAGEPELGDWTVDETVLYRSFTRPTGAVHQALARAPLRK